jgi:hypothetical protein
MPSRTTRLTRRIFVKQIVGGTAAYAAYSLLLAGRVLGGTTVSASVSSGPEVAGRQSSRPRWTARRLRIQLLPPR